MTLTLSMTLSSAYLIDWADWALLCWVAARFSVNDRLTTVQGRSRTAPNCQAGANNTKRCWGTAVVESLARWAWNMLVWVVEYGLICWMCRMCWMWQSWLRIHRIHDIHDLRGRLTLDAGGWSLNPWPSLDFMKSLELWFGMQPTALVQNRLDMTWHQKTQLLANYSSSDLHSERLMWKRQNLTWNDMNSWKASDACINLYLTVWHVFWHIVWHIWSQRDSQSWRGRKKRRKAERKDSWRENQEYLTWHLGNCKSHDNADHACFIMLCPSSNGNAMHCTPCALAYLKWEQDLIIWMNLDGDL